MKAIGIIFLATLFLATGCSTNRGGAGDQYQYQTQDESTPPGPIPSGSLVRPGMNPDSIRDPASVTRPYEPRPNYP